MTAGLHLPDQGEKTAGTCDISGPVTPSKSSQCSPNLLSQSSQPLQESKWSTLCVFYQAVTKGRRWLPQHGPQKVRMLGRPASLLLVHAEGSSYSLRMLLLANKKQKHCHMYAKCCSQRLLTWPNLSSFSPGSPQGFPS